jgi:hypothetical protein
MEDLVCRWFEERYGHFVSLLQVDNETMHSSLPMHLKILFNIQQWRESKAKLLIPFGSRDYLPLLALTGDIAILPLRVLSLKSFELLVQPTDYVIDILSSPSHFEEIRAQICESDYFLHDKLDFKEEYWYGAVVSPDNLLQAAVIISAQGNLRVFHSLSSSLTSTHLRELILFVIHEWIGYFRTLGSSPLDLLVVFSSLDRVVDSALTEIGFSFPDHGGGNGLFDEIVFSPSSLLSVHLHTDMMSPCPCPDEIVLLMGQSNMSGRGPLFGSTGLLPHTPSSSSPPSLVIHQILQAVQQELHSVSYSGQRESPPLPLRLQVTDDAVQVSYSEPYADRVLRYDFQSRKWRSTLLLSSSFLCSFLPSPLDDVVALHQRVDILKSVGLGPGITFASHYLHLREVFSSLSPPSHPLKGPFHDRTLASGGRRHIDR